MLAILSLILEGRSVRWQLQQVARCGIVIGLMVLAYDCDYCTVSTALVTVTIVGGTNSREDGGAFRSTAVVVNGAAWYAGACLSFTKLFIRG